METAKDNKEKEHGKIRGLESQLQPRELLKEKGAENLTDEQLIAILLGSGIPGKNVMELSKEMVKWADGQWTTLAKLSLQEMTTIFKGIGEVKAMHLIAALEVGRRHNLGRKTIKRITSSEDVVDLMYLKAADKDVEHFWVIMLNHRNSIIAVKEIATGGITGVAIDVRVLMRMVLQYQATGMIVVHNHPSGSTMPSEADRRITEQIEKACRVLDIRFIDHVIVTSDKENYYSFYGN